MSRCSDHHIDLKLLFRIQVLALGWRSRNRSLNLQHRASRPFGSLRLAPLAEPTTPITSGSQFIAARAACRTYSIGSRLASVPALSPLGSRAVQHLNTTSPAPVNPRAGWTGVQPVSRTRRQGSRHDDQSVHGVAKDCAVPVDGNWYSVPGHWCATTAQCRSAISRC